MSRRLNRVTLPLHKPEAFARVLAITRMYLRNPPQSNDWIDLVAQAFMGWSLTYVATPIAVAVRVALFTCSSLHVQFYCCCVQLLVRCTAAMSKCFC